MTQAVRGAAQRSRRRLLARAAVAVGLACVPAYAAGCSGEEPAGSAESVRPRAVETRSEPAAAPSARAASDRTERPGRDRRRRPAVTTRDAAILDALVAFARAPRKRTWSAVPFAERVGLGLGPRLVARKTARELLDPRAWTLHLRMFRAYVGRVSALELIADERRLVFRAGPHRHCASPPVPAPRALASLRRLSIQPRHVDSCLQWFTVDAFVTDAAEIEAITLDLWEP